MIKNLKAVSLYQDAVGLHRLSEKTDCGHLEKQTSGTTKEVRYSIVRVRIRADSKCAPILTILHKSTDQMRLNSKGIVC